MKILTIQAMTFFCLISCSNVQKNNHNVLVSSDIIYDLKNQKLEEYVYEKLYVKGKVNISYCEFEWENAISTITFYTEDDYNSNIKKMISSTNRKLKVKEKLIPILFFTDFLYAEQKIIPIKEVVGTKNTIIIKFDNTGKILDEDKIPPF